MSLGQSISPLNLPRVWTRVPSTYESIPSVRIVTGTLRGRRIASNRLGNLRLTSSRLKESIFAMLGPDLKGSHFLDLCAGSGQMGLEALSRGAHVVFNEPDRRRYSILRSMLREWRVGAQMFDTRAEMLIPIGDSKIELHALEASEILCITAEQLEMLQRNEVRLTAQWTEELVCVLSDQVEEANTYLKFTV